MKNLNKICLVILAMIIFSSCIKKKFDFDRISQDIEWEPIIVAPGAKAKLTIRDILQDYDSNEVFVVDETGFLFIMYHSHVFSAKAKDLIVVPDQNIPNDIFTGQEYINQNFTTSDDTVSINHNSQISFNFGTSRAIDSLIIKDGILNVTVQSEFLHTGTAVMTIPSLTKNGVPYSKTVNINTSDGSFVFTDAFTDINDYTLSLTNGSSNEFTISNTITLYNTGNAINSTDQGIISTSFSNLEFKKMFGYVGQDTISINDTIHLEIFDNAYEGSAYFEDPHFNVFINNSYGLPITMEMDSFTTFTAINNSYDYFPFSNSLIIYLSFKSNISSKFLLICLFCFLISAIILFISLIVFSFSISLSLILPLKPNLIESGFH